jgi:hypothetical protein
MAKPKGGRPKKPASERLEVQISFRVTKAAAKAADQEAAKRGLGGGRNELARRLLSTAVARRRT